MYYDVINILRNTLIIIYTRLLEDIWGYIAEQGTLSLLNK